MTENSANGKRILLVIVLALAGWGLYHTIGVFRSEPDAVRGLVKAGIVFAAMALFLGWWGLLLLARKRRLADHRSPPDEREPLE